MVSSISTPLPCLSLCSDEVVANGTGSVVIDIADLTFIDSTGVAVLVDCHQHLNASGRRLRLVNFGVQSAGVFDMAGLSETVTEGGP